MQIVREHYPVLRRAAFACFGLVFIALGCADVLDDGRWSAGELFGSLAFIPVAMGMALIALALFEYQDEWRIGPQGVTVVRRSVFASKTVPLRPGDADKAAIRTHEWESRPITYSIEIKTGKRSLFSTREIASRAEAEALLAAIKSSAGSLS